MPFKLFHFSYNTDDWKVLISKEEVVFARTSPEQKLIIVKVSENLSCVLSLLTILILSPLFLFSNSLIFISLLSTDLYFFSTLHHYFLVLTYYGII